MTLRLINSILAIASNVFRGLLWISVIKYTGKELYGDITTINTSIAYLSIFIGLELFRVINKPMLDDNVTEGLFFFERLIITFLLAGTFTYVLLMAFPVVGDFKTIYLLLLISIILENINVEIGRIFNFSNIFLPPTIGNSFFTLFVPLILIWYRIDTFQHFLLIIFAVTLFRFFWFLAALYYFNLFSMFKVVKLNFRNLLSKYKIVLPFVVIACFEAILPIFDRIMLKKYTEILGLFNLFTMMFALAPLIFDSYFVYPQFKELKKRFVDEGDKRVLRLPTRVLVLLVLGLAIGILLDDVLNYIMGQRLVTNLDLVIFVIPLILLNSFRGFAYLLFYFAERQSQYLVIYVSIEIAYIISIIALTFSKLNFEIMFFSLNIIFHAFLVIILYSKLAYEKTA